MRLGLCTFSCQHQWAAVRSKRPGTKFTDAATYFDYARSLGAEGVQTSVHTAEDARAMRARVEQTGGCYEGDVAFPKNENALATFEQQLKLAKEAGATVVRSVAMGGRRYEVFKSLDEFTTFAAHSEKMLGLIEPILKKHRVRLALENHKDRLVSELLEVLHRLSSEWVGVNVDTGNNLALLEEPHAVVEALAPFAASVHLKDMGVQAQDDGFLLSEVILGTGTLDLPRIVATLGKANPSIVFNLEMGTREPLRVPCLEQLYWATFPQRPASELARTLSFVKQHPPASPLPTINDKSPEQQIAFEEANNRACVEWMRAHINT